MPRVTVIVPARNLGWGTGLWAGAPAPVALRSFPVGGASSAWKRTGSVWNADGSERR